MSASPRRSFAFWLATGFGSGLAPKAPGTFGSLAALLPWLLMRDLPAWAYLAAIVATFAIGCWACSVLIRDLGREDPGMAVIDEWVGMWITLFAAPPEWWWAAIGFGLFRLFDIWKPWPVRWADRRLHGGFGAMADDAMAGLLGLLALQGLVLLTVALST